MSISRLDCQSTSHAKGPSNQCFIWIFLGAPYIERLRGNHRLSAAFSAITAAAVGVVLHLAVWLAWYVWFLIEEPTNYFVILVNAILLYGFVKHKWEVIPVVLGAGGSTGSSSHRPNLTLDQAWSGFGPGPQRHQCQQDSNG